ncbi:hypothetical protein OROMI_004767 [Orobanche minor]
MAPKDKGKGKKQMLTKPKPKPFRKSSKQPKEGACFHCNETGHWKRNCKVYLEEMRKRKSSETAASGLRRSTQLAKGEIDLRVGNKARVAAIAIGTYYIKLPSGLILELNNCYCAPAIGRNNISVSCLDLKGYNFTIENSVMSIFNKGIFYGDALMSGRLYPLNLESSKSLFVCGSLKEEDDITHLRIWVIDLFFELRYT